MAEPAGGVGLLPGRLLGPSRLRTQAVGRRELGQRTHDRRIVQDRPGVVLEGYWSQGLAEIPRLAALELQVEDPDAQAVAGQERRPLDRDAVDLDAVRALEVLDEPGAVLAAQLGV